MDQGNNTRKPSEQHPLERLMFPGSGGCLALFSCGLGRAAFLRGFSDDSHAMHLLAVVETLNVVLPEVIALARQLRVREAAREIHP
jgi:hypothetical protein